MKQILIATKNKGKIAEFKQFFATVNVEVVSLLDLEEPVPDIEETGQTFEENAALKAEEIAQMFNIAVLADDSGLIIDALDGRPGIFSARYAGEPTDDKANIRKVLDELAEIPAAERSARFVCVLAIAAPNKATVFYKGYCEGTITNAEKGENGFGYDPIFIPEGYTKTMAELSPDEKNSISHRKNAISQLEKGIHSK
ncbi:XTP/dITP diphosphatase [Oceanobacillus chungangensis]|uniref:dITP/XTP pyrophosphatase n=1 Tax=Oceanobacillus chungangensis TaxID=1229152 RepID=A0A3D8Q0R1_9BACI|nr:XTP/dITP diphosphatase [Oceanobacillus chungangensis]RDW21642.1 non-canonical purine NTP pyrophosphatase [Oceanobacillus chungangensis]